MNSLLNHNAELLFRHRDLIDSLTKEAADLREAQIKLAQVFSTLPPELVTPETFELMMRDLHTAHHELSTRLQNLMQHQAGLEISTANQQVSDIENELNDTRNRVADLENKLSETQGRVAEMEERLRREESRHQQTQSDKQETEKTFNQYREQVRCTVHHIKNDYLKKLNSVSIWEQTKPICDIMHQLLEWQQGDLDRAQEQLDNSKQTLWNIKEKIDLAISQLPSLWSSQARGTLNNVVDTLCGFANNFPAGQQDRNSAKEKTLRLLEQVDENATLTQLLSELNSLCDKLS